MKTVKFCPPFFFSQACKRSSFSTYSNKEFAESKKMNIEFKKCAALYFMIISSLFVLSCTSSGFDQKTSTAEEIFKLDIESVDFGNFSISQFTKNDGYENDYFGQKFYTIEFSAIITSSTDVDFYNTYWTSVRKIKNYKIEFPKDAAQVNPTRARDRFFKGASMQFKRNAPINITGKIEMIQTENGWRRASS